MSKYDIQKLLTSSNFLCNNKFNKNKGKGRKKINKKIESVQKWLPFEEIMEDGIIKISSSNYVKLIKVLPINFNLKSELEKEAILNSYKIFLKTCNFDIQIIIQTNKVDLSNYFSKIKEKNKSEDLKIRKYSEKHIIYLNELNIKNNSSSKNFYILIKNSPISIKENNINIIVNEFNDKYYKIKECLARCGNNVVNVNNRKEIIDILNTFFNKGR